MKIKTILRIVTGLILVLVFLQFINSPKNISASVTSQNFAKSFNAPKNIENILRTSCFDCHSNNTVYPWYGNIQPAEMFLAKHIYDGKEKLNFDDLNNLGRRQRYSKFSGIIKQIKQNKMPLKSYILMHTEARLSEKDKKDLIDFFESLKSQ